MAVLHALLITVVLVETVLSAVNRQGDNNNYIKDSTVDFIKSAIREQVVNNTIVSNKTVEKLDTKALMSHPNPKEELKEEGRKKQPDIMTRILPMMIIPFMLQTAIIPMMLIMLKMMLIKSAFIGKMAILLGFLNMFRNNKNQGGIHTHDITIAHPHSQMDEKLAEGHYGYHGYDEYGPYVNRKRSFR